MDTVRAFCTCVLLAQFARTTVRAKCTYSDQDNKLNVTCRGETGFPHGIPNNVFSLDLSYCRIKQLHREDVQRFSNMTSFRIVGSRLQTVDYDAFADNRKLSILDLSSNKDIESTALRSIICNLAKTNGDLKELYLSVLIINSSDFPQILRCLEQMELSVLDLSSSVKGPLKDYTFSKMTSLRVLKLGSIYPVNLLALVNLTLLNTLRLSDAKLNEIPNFYDPHTNGTLLPGLTALYLDSNSITKFPAKSVGLENLEFLSMRNNHLISFTATEMETLSTNLTTLFLNTNKNIKIELCSFSSNLRRLELRDCRIQFSRKVRNIFRNLTLLRGLSLTKNYFDQSDEALGTMFRGLSRLTHLSLDNCALKRLPDTTFLGLRNLVMLVLSGNRLPALSSKLFGDLASLQTLNLAGNQLTAVDKGFIRGLPPSLRKVDFARNPFVCNCNLLWFMKFFRSGSVHFLELDTNDAYKCYNPPEMRGQNLTSFWPTDADCIHLSFAAKLSIILSAVAAAVAAVAVTAYRFRWYIGYAYFVLRAKRGEARENSDKTPYVYDAFVVYNKHDLAWVRDRLLPVLEGDAHLRLCVHDRDWLGGYDVIDNIVQSIESSRKTLLVVSNAFAASQWCQLEMTLAQHRLLAEDRNALVLVLLETIERRNVTPRLLLQMRQQTYLEWTDDPTGERMFWKKLLRSVRKPVSSVIHSSSVNRRNVSVLAVRN